MTAHTPAIVLVRADDWVALYFNGVKAAEGHSLSPAHILDALGLPYEERDAPRISSDEGEVVFDERLDRVRVERWGDEL